VRTLIRGGTLIDGTGSPRRRGDLLVEGDRIAEVGETSLAPDEVIDASGLVVAPGFIDVHSHGDFSLPGDPHAAAKVRQGVTTEVVGNCGLGLQPANAHVDAMYERVAPLVFGEGAEVCSRDLADYRARLDARGTAVNAACLIPHGNVRCAVLGMTERAPTASELEAMGQLVDAGMDQGAFGLSSGLVYPPGAYAKTDELVALASRLRPFGGIYASHIRNEGSRLLASVSEAIEIGERAGVPVQISHLKAAGQPNWGRVVRALELVDEAVSRGVDVHADVYPYTAGSTVLSAMFVPLWAFEGSVSDMVGRLRDPVERERVIADAKAQLLAYVDLPPWLAWIPKRWLLPLFVREMGRLVVVSSVRKQKQYEGRPIGQIARERKNGLHDAMLDLLVEEDTAVAAIAHVMSENDVRTVLSHPRTMVGTDGFPLKDGKPHPRTYGTYPRVLEHYVLETGLLSLEQAIHRMTGLVARKLGLSGRGVLETGAFADLVVLDPRGVHDRSTYDDPCRPPEGVPHVMVSGTFTVRDARQTDALPGRVLRR
jgi:N-acyl-D-amino-acid deacylase